LAVRGEPEIHLGIEELMQASGPARQLEHPTLEDLREPIEETPPCPRPESLPLGVAPFSEHCRDGAIGANAGIDGPHHQVVRRGIIKGVVLVAGDALLMSPPKLVEPLDHPDGGRRAGRSPDAEFNCGVYVSVYKFPYDMGLFMMNRALILTVLAAIAVPAVASTDLQVNQTYNTGYNGSTPIAGGQPDLYFTLFNGANITTPVVADPIPVAYGPVPAGAQWIAPTEDQADDPPAPIAGDPPGEYGYAAALSTDFLVPTEVTFTGEFESDNSAILEIGNSNTVVISVANPAFLTPTSFSFTLTLGTGSISTPIVFYVNNVADGNMYNGVSANPTGLLVSNLKISTAAPEPSTWILMFAGLGSLFMVKRICRAVPL
jgi:hypothetical protein